MKVLFLATHFRNQLEVLAFVEMLSRLPRPENCEVNVSITDNSRDWSEHVGQLPHCVQVHCPEENLGYLNGCDRAFQQLGQTQSDVDFVIVTNTDVSLHVSFFYTLNSLIVSDDVGVLAPAIRLLDGTPQNPHLTRRPSKPQLLLYCWMFKSMWGLRLLDLGASATRAISRMLKTRNHSTTDPRVSDRSVIYAAHGSLFLLRPVFFKRGGRLGYRAFMYGEELHIGEQARRLHLHVLYLPQLSVEHNAHAVTGRTSLADRSRYKRESLEFILSHYYSAISSNSECQPNAYHRADWKGVDQRITDRQESTVR